jgi:hypothetical protein
MASSSSMDQAIEQEERLIRLYKAELSLLKQQQERRTHSSIPEQHPTQLPVDQSTASPATHSNDGVDPLDWILQQQPQASVSSLMTSVAVEEDRFREDLQDMQSALRTFCFTCVDRVATTSKNKERQTRASDYEPDDSTLVSYNFQGYFEFDPSIKADIVVDFRLGREDRKGQARVLGIDCKLSSEKDEDLTWLQQESRIKGEDETNLSKWIDGLSNYLQFDKRRKQFLSAWEEKGYVEVKHVRSKSIVKIPLQPRDEVGIDDEDPGNVSENDQTCVSIVWGWKWKVGRDVLRLAQASSALGLRQQDLDSLVKTCDSCERAIELVIPTRGKSGNDSDDSEVLGELSERESLSSSDRKSRNKRNKGRSNISTEPLLQDPVDDADDEGDAFHSDRDDDITDDENNNDGGSQDEWGAADGGDMSEYELMRLERIKRNEMRLAELGLKGIEKKADKKPRRRYRTKKDRKVVPRRRLSSRLIKQLEEEDEDQVGKDEAAEQPLHVPGPSRQSELMKQRWANPEFRRKVIASKKRSRGIEETGASLQIAEAQHDDKQLHSDEEENQLEKVEALNAPSTSQSELMKQRWANPDFRRKVITSKKRSREIKQIGEASLQIGEARHDNLGVASREQPQSRHAKGVASLPLSNDEGAFIHSNSDERRVAYESASEDSIEVLQPQKKRGRPTQRKPSFDESAQDTASSEPGHRVGLMQRFFDKMKPLPVPDEDKEKQSETDSLQKMERADSKRLEEVSSASNDLPVVLVQPIDKSKKNTLHQNKKPPPSDVASFDDSTQPKLPDLFQEYLKELERRGQELPLHVVKSSAASRPLAVEKKRGRPKGSKNKQPSFDTNATTMTTAMSPATKSEMTVNTAAQLPDDMMTSPDSLALASAPSAKISKSSHTLLTTAEFHAEAESPPSKMAKKRGRPKGSKEHTHALPVLPEKALVVEKKRGRPKGSKNKQPPLETKATTLTTATATSPTTLIKTAMNLAAQLPVDRMASPDSLALVSVPGAEVFKANGTLPTRPEFHAEVQAEPQPSKMSKKRGRPKGSKSKAKRPVDALPTLSENPMPKKRGRPPKEGSKKKEKKSTVQVVDNNLDAG